MKLNRGTILILTAATTMSVACGKKKKDGGSSEEAPIAQQPQQEPAKEEEKKADEEKKTTPENLALYQPANVPQKFSLAFPGSLAIEAGSGASLCLADECGPSEGEGDGGGIYKEAAPEAAAPDESQSHGLSELRYQLDSIRWRIKDYTQRFATSDTVISAHKADCDDADGCEIKDAKATVTKEMVNLMIENAGGKAAFGAKELAEMNELVGDEFPIGDIKVTHPTNDVNGFTTIITITNNNGANDKHELVLAFAKDGDKYTKVRVKEDSAGSYEPMYDDVAIPTSEEMPTPAAALTEPAKPETVTFSTKFQLDFDSIAQSLVVTDDSDVGSNKFKNSFRFAADPAKAAKHGTTFQVVIDSGSDEGHGYAQKTNGFADDDGAYLQTVYSYDMVQATIALSTAPEAGHRYELFLGDDVTAAGLNADPFAFWSQGSVDEYGSYYWGMQPIPDEAEFTVFDVSYAGEGEEFKQVYADSGRTVTSITATTTRVKSAYSEQVDAKGKLVGFCYWDQALIGADDELTGDPYCTTGWNEESPMAEAYDSYVSEDGGFEVKGAIVSKLSGVSFSSLKGEWFYIVRAQADIEQYTTLLNAAWNDGAENGAFEQIIGDGSYFGDPDIEAAVSADPNVNDVYNVNFYAEPEAATGAHIMVFHYDSLSGSYLFQPIAGTVTAEVQ